jgi:nitrite reductase (cytochrome c-552)
MTPNGSRRKLYGLVAGVSAAATFLVLALLMNIAERKREGQERFVRLVELTEDTIDPAVWGRNFPRQYDGYLKTADAERTRYGGSEAFAPSRLEENPSLKRIFAGYPFSVDFREARGHAYMLSDQDVSRRTTEFKQPGACLHCHSSVMGAYRAAGDGDVTAGFEKVCAMPLSEARKLVEHPVSCVDCHDPQTVGLRVTRPAFLAAMRELAQSHEPLPHLPSVERWRASDRAEPYDVNRWATRQELRSFVCAQCHVEYYFRGDSKIVTYPWRRGLKVEQMEAYYDDVGHADWTHAETGAAVLKAQHPEFEMWSQGIHARSGVACADCHMPYKREGAVKISDHHVRSPMLNVSRACQTCHRYSEEEIQGRVRTLQQRTQALQTRAQDALLDLIDALVAAQAQNAPEDRLNAARALQRKAQWRVDFCDAENSQGFHAAQEYARILGEAIDYARQGQIEILQPAKE